MRRSRAISFLAALLTLNLTLNAADEACATHGQHERAAAAASHAAMHHSMSEQSHRGKQLPCKTPVRAQCCRALTSCSQSVALSERDTRAPLHDAASMRAGGQRAPKSRVAAPEPPPPRVLTA
jgi:hypothetical protein